MEPARDLIIRAKPYWAAFNASSYIKELTIGNIWLAHGFIDFMLEVQNSAELTNLIGSGNPNRDARRYIDSANAANQAVFPTPAIKRRLEMLRDLDRKQRRVLSRMWTEIKVR